MLQKVLKMTGVKLIIEKLTWQRVYKGALTIRLTVKPPVGECMNKLENYI